jgi:hypothetical protein
MREIAYVRAHEREKTKSACRASPATTNHDSSDTCLSLVMLATIPECGFSPFTSLTTNPGPKSAKI